MLPDFDSETYLPKKKISTQQTWEGMEECKKRGLAKSIGVSNCTTSMLMDMLTYCKVVPAVNQIECHPYLT